MVVSKHNIISLFFTYNNEYFGGVLPMPNLKIRHTYRTLGYFYCDINDDGSISNPCIEISDNYDYTEYQLKNILVHEMIHYYLTYMGLDIKCHHGKEFNKMSNEFNKKYGMNITPTIDLSSYTIREGKSQLMFTLSTLF